MTNSWARWEERSRRFRCRWVKLVAKSARGRWRLLSASAAWRVSRQRRRALDRAARMASPDSARGSPPVPESSASSSRRRGRNFAPSCRSSSGPEWNSRPRADRSGLRAGGLQQGVSCLAGVGGLGFRIVPGEPDQGFPLDGESANRFHEILLGMSGELQW